MASFQELWDGSRKFRQIFLYNKVLKSVRATGEVDMGRAEWLWHERYPQIEWGFCYHEGCNALAVMGEKCSKHFKEMGARHSWEWRHGVLYKLKLLHNRRKRRVNGCVSVS